MDLDTFLGASASACRLTSPLMLMALVVESCRPCANCGRIALAVDSVGNLYNFAVCLRSLDCLCRIAAILSYRDFDCFDYYYSDDFVPFDFDCRRMVLASQLLYSATVRHHSPMKLTFCCDFFAVDFSIDVLHVPLRHQKNHRSQWVARCHLPNWHLYLSGSSVQPEQWNLCAPFSVQRRQLHRSRCFCQLYLVPYWIVRNKLVTPHFPLHQILGLGFGFLCPRRVRCLCRRQQNSAAIRPALKQSIRKK